MDRKSSRLIQSQKQNPKNKEMQIVGPINSTSTSASSSNSSTPFKLPNGWVVERRPRRTTDGSDKYYYEPRTGRKFRSLVSIQKYLNGEIDAGPKQLPDNEKNLYIEPGTGKRFHSLISVERYLAESKEYGATLKEYAATLKALKAGDLLYLTDGKGHTAVRKASKLRDQKVACNKVATSITEHHSLPVKVKMGS